MANHFPGGIELRHIAIFFTLCRWPFGRCDVYLKDGKAIGAGRVLKMLL